jgi:enterochelin esterase-like enzyme
VFYLLHGGGDEDSGWSTIGRAGFIVDNLIAAQKAIPMIIVMPSGSLPRPANMPQFAPGTTLSPEVRAAMEKLQVNHSVKLLSISVGDRDFALAGSKAFAGMLEKHGIKHEVNISGGGHTWINWRHYLNDFAPKLFRSGTDGQLSNAP